MSARGEGAVGGRSKVRLGEFSLEAGKGEADATGDVKIVIRPERVVLEEQGSTGQNRIPAMVERVVYVGSLMQVILNLAPGGRIQAWVQNQGDGIPYEQGRPVTVHFPVDALRVLVDTGAVAPQADEASAQAAVS
jgi:hypothetical protein